MTASTAPVEVVYDQLPGPTEEPISPALLAEVTGMGYSTVTRHLRALAAAGRADKVDPAERGTPVLWFRTAKTPATNRPEPEPEASTSAGSGHQTPARRATAELADGARPDGPVQHPQSRAGEAHAGPDAQATFPRPADEAETATPAADAGDPAGPAAVLPSPPDQPEPDDPTPVSSAPASGDVAEVAEWMQSARPVSAVPAPMAAPADRLTEAEARALTAEIRARVTDLLPLIKQAFTRRADLALGYQSWAAYCDAELRGLRMPLGERQSATAALHAEGMSTRAIAGALGTSDATVRRDLRDAGATDHAPERVVGLDGKRYASSRPMTAAEVGDLASADADGEGLSSRGPARASAAPAAPAGAGAAGVTTDAEPVDPYEPDPAARAASVAEVAPGFVRVIDGEAVETPAVDDRHDPGPVPEPPALDPAVRDRIENALNQVEQHIGDLATWLYRAGDHGPAWIHAVRNQRQSLDQIIRRLDEVDG
ncbi:hypothetical protein [Micromonospora sp. NPDC004551]|uniref:helix-turn-helix domain-containing protein n=1 Tax=Micromonospora sp. NPDC004551 TaxID=3154284 RepID=UPI0033B678D2